MHFLAGLMKRQMLPLSKVSAAGTPAGWITLPHQVQGISQPECCTRAAARHQHRPMLSIHRKKKKNRKGGKFLDDLVLPPDPHPRLTIMNSKAPAPQGGAQSSAWPM